jgi:hypothetical protein
VVRPTLVTYRSWSVLDRSNERDHIVVRHLRAVSNGEADWFEATKMIAPPYHNQNRRVVNS